MIFLLADATYRAVLANNVECHIKSHPQPWIPN
jgi:hypothetical protein